MPTGASAIKTGHKYHNGINSIYRIFEAIFVRGQLPNSPPRTTSGFKNPKLISNNCQQPLVNKYIIKEETNNQDVGQSSFVPGFHGFKAG